LFSGIKIIVIDSEVYLSVVVPAYNEEGRLESPLIELVQYLTTQSFSSEIICVNDGSTDRTLEIMRSVAEKYPIVRVISYDENRGKGYAVKQGVLGSYGSYVLFTDADMNTPIEEVSRLLEHIQDFDIVIGSRAGKQQDRPAIREFGSRFLNIMIQLLAVPGIRDTQCGFKLFRSEAARMIFEKTILNRFSFDIEVLYLARRFGYTVKEVQVQWFYRGGSKVRPIRDGLRFLRDMIRIRRHDYNLEPGRKHEV
jgi:dolichyl-phosphate beta-glucosyltransferase